MATKTGISGTVAGYLSFDTHSATVPQIPCKKAGKPLCKGPESRNKQYTQSHPPKYLIETKCHSYLSLYIILHPTSSLSFPTPEQSAGNYSGIQILHWILNQVQNDTKTGLAMTDYQL
jgi:hypothetical protein